MAIESPTIDVQVHAYERNYAGRPWAGFLQGPDEVTGDDMVAAMDAVGVDGAILISPFSLYQYDASTPLRCMRSTRIVSVWSDLLIRTLSLLQTTLQLGRILPEWLGPELC